MAAGTTLAISHLWAAIRAREYFGLSDVSWRKASRAVIVAVTLLTIGIALLAGHVSTASRPPASSPTPPSPGLRTCALVTPPLPGHHRPAIKCP
jgi:hypothetical protein